MKKKVIWLVVSGWMVAALLLTSCAPAVVEEAERVAPKEKEVVVPKEEVVPKEVVVPKEEPNLVKWTGTKQDGTVVERMIEKPRYGGVHVTAGPVVPIIWDDHTIRGTSNWAVNPVQETLWIKDPLMGAQGTEEWSPQISLVPVPPEPVYTGKIAESWEILDHQTIKWNIRKGVHWALDPDSEASRLMGGRELTAADVVWGYRRNWDIGYVQRFIKLSDPDNVENSVYVDPDDPWAVIFKGEPNKANLFLRVMGGVHHHISAPEVVQTFGELATTGYGGGDIAASGYGEILDWRHVVGTGPFMLKDYVDGSALTYARNPDYWMRDAFFPENQLPYVDTFKFLIVPDLSTRLAALRTGKIDNLPVAAVGPGGETAFYKEEAEQLIKTNPELEFIRFYNPTSETDIAMRVDTKPFDDIRVRRALNMAVNQQELLDDYYEGDALMFVNPIPPIAEYMDWYVPLEEMPQSVQELYQYKPDKARQLLAEAGYPDGFKTSVIALPGDVDLLSILKEYWADIGVELEIEVRDYSVWRSIWVRKTHTQMYTGGHGMSGTGVALVYGGPLGNYSQGDPSVKDALRSKLSTAEYYLDNDKMKAGLTEEIVADGMPWNVWYNEQVYGISLPVPYQYQFWQPWLKGYNGGNYYLAYSHIDWPPFVWIDQELKKSMGR